MKRRWRRRAVAALLLLALGPAGPMLALRWVDPPTTMVMLARSWDRWRKHKTPVYPRREVVSLAAISPELVRAVLASEDDAFYLHHGFDLRQMKRAIIDRKGRTRMRGASTLSQQTVKNIFLWNGRSWVRKGLEAYLTLYLELLLPKDRILELYLSLAECADGAFGMQACARQHFNKPARALGAEESARLASILPSPRLWSLHGDDADRRVAPILERMQQAIARP